VARSFAVDLQVNAHLPTTQKQAPKLLAHPHTTILRKPIIAMTHANLHTEYIRIRTILEISAFDFATLESNLIHNAYIPSSTNEQQIRDATYRFCMASKNAPPHFYISPGRFNIFDPYPYGGMLQDDPNLHSGAHNAAAMAHRNERESAKYDAVTDLIRMLAAREMNEAYVDEAKVSGKQDMVKVLEKQLEAEKGKVKTAEGQLQKLTAKYAAVKLLVGSEHAAEVRKIEKSRHKKSGRQGPEPLAATTDDIAQGLAELSFAENAASPVKVDEKLQDPELDEAGGNVRQEHQETVEVRTAEERLAASVARASMGPDENGKKRRIRVPRALKNARAAEMAAANEMADGQKAASALNASTDSCVE
jgi:hypothetical protein